MESSLKPPAASTSSGRLSFLDWTRGLAAVVMLNGHVFHSFTRTDLRTQDTFVLSQFIGGLPPAIFLFLTGVTLAFMMDKQDRQGAGTGQRMRAALSRAGYLAVLAVAFRLQLWFFSYPYGDAQGLFRVDILNCMGFGIAAMSVMALFTTLERVRLCAILGLAIASAAPLVSLLDLNALHPFLRSYFVPHADSFSFFPWAAFLAFGLSAGSILRLAAKEQLQMAVQWGGWMGLVLVVGAQYFANIPYTLYPKAADFWLNSPALILIKLGVILMLLSFAYLWNTYMVTGWSWVRQLGTTSLLVYWVHTELVYGRWFGAWKEGLNTPQTLLMAAMIIATMLCLSLVKTRWAQIREFAGKRLEAAGIPEAD